MVAPIVTSDAALPLLAVGAMAFLPVLIGRVNPIATRMLTSACCAGLVAWILTQQPAIENVIGVIYCDGWQGYFNVLCW